MSMNLKKQSRKAENFSLFTDVRTRIISQSSCILNSSTQLYTQNGEDTLFCLITGAAQNDAQRHRLFCQFTAQLHESYVVLPDHSGECDTTYVVLPAHARDARLE